MFKSPFPSRKEGRKEGRGDRVRRDDDRRDELAWPVKFSASVTFPEWVDKEDKEERIMPPMIYVAIGRPQHLPPSTPHEGRKEGRKETGVREATRGRPLDAYTAAINLLRAASVAVGLAASESRVGRGAA